jgi:hypothetical protein
LVSALHLLHKTLFAFFAFVLQHQPSSSSRKCPFNPSKSTMNTTTMTGPPTKKQRLGGPLFPDGEVRSEITFTPPQRPRINETEGNKLKHAQADQSMSRARCPFVEVDSGGEDSTAAASVTENQQVGPNLSHAAKPASAIDFFKNRTAGQTARVGKRGLKNAIDFYASIAAKKQTARANTIENMQLMRLAKIGSIATDTGMTASEIEAWVKSAADVLREWHLCVINSPKHRAGLLVSLGEDRTNWDDIAFRVAKLCVDETLGVINKETQILNYSCRCAQAACKIVLVGKAAGLLTDTNLQNFDLWRHQCAVRLLFAAVADFLDRPDGYFAHLLGVPIPNMHKRNQVVWDWQYC